MYTYTHMCIFMHNIYTYTDINHISLFRVESHIAHYKHLCRHLSPANTTISHMGWEEGSAGKGTGWHA